MQTNHWCQLFFEPRVGDVMFRCNSSAFQENVSVLHSYVLYASFVTKRETCCCAAQLQDISSSEKFAFHILVHTLEHILHIVHCSRVGYKKHKQSQKGWMSWTILCDPERLGEQTDTWIYL